MLLSFVNALFKVKHNVNDVRATTKRKTAIRYTKRKHTPLRIKFAHTTENRYKKNMHDEKPHVAAKAAWTENICEFKQVFFLLSTTIFRRTYTYTNASSTGCECVRVYFIVLYFFAIVSSTTGQRML